MRLAWLINALAFALLVSYIQHEALANYWYWRYIWLDTLVHLLGGVAVASFVVAVLDRFRARVFLAAMLAVALGWEAFEYVINAEREANFAFDTALDLLMDAAGMSAAYITARFTIWRSA